MGSNSPEPKFDMIKQEYSEDLQTNIDLIKTEDNSLPKKEELPVIADETPQLPPTFACPYCPQYKTSCKNHLTTHIIDKHTLINETTWYKCGACDHEAQTRDELENHMSDDHSVVWYDCKHCEFKTKAKESLHNHVIVKHTPDEDIRWFRCPHCEYKGKCKHNLAHHFKSRHVESEEILTCQECDYTTKVKRNLRLHVKSRHSDCGKIKWVECGLCDYKTKRKYYLKLHMMSKHPVSE